MLRAPTQASTPKENRVEDIEEAARNKQKAGEMMSERMRRVAEGRTAKSIWDLL